MTTNLYDANRQWASRPDDQRFVSLADLQAHVRRQRASSAAKVVSSRRLAAAPVAGDDQGLTLAGPDGAPVGLTHWSFGQVASLAGAPAGYLRTLPSPMAADCLNYGLHHARDIEDVGVLLRRDEDDVARLVAATGPNYGRVWNVDVVDALVERVGNGVTGDWRVPGIAGKPLAEVTKADTTLYASDRDMWVFLADEEHRIEMPDRRDGQPGAFARGVIVSNSEVGSATLSVKTFLFDFVCANRIIWGAHGVQSIRVRHTVSAPDRWMDEVVPALQMYAQQSTAGVLDAIKSAKAQRLGGGLANETAVSDFLAKRFGRGTARAIEAAHLADEGRPIETLWDVVTGATAYARSLPHQDARVALEEEAGALLAA